MMILIFLINIFQMGCPIKMFSACWSCSALRFFGQFAGVLEFNLLTNVNNVIEIKYN